jgi:hypothetical protein
MRAPDPFAYPALALCGAVLAMILTFTVAVWSTGALGPPLRTTAKPSAAKPPAFDPLDQELCQS